MKKNTIIDGIAASEHLDSSGESLSIKGMDISSLGGPDSILNWEHGSKDRPSQVVGKVTFAKKMLKASDAKTKREKYFWNKVKKPMVYIKAELFDGIGHSGAQDVAAMLRYKNKDKGEDSRLVVGFSIEGGKMEKKGMVVTKSIARDVAITVKPCNKVCDAELIEDDVDEDFLYKNQQFDCEILNKGDLKLNKGFRQLILEDIKKSLPSKDDFNANAQRMIDTKSFKQKSDIADRIGKLASKPLSQPPEAKPKRQFTPDNAPKRDMQIGDRINYGKKGAYKPKTGKDIYSNPDTWKSENNMRKAIVAGMMGGSPDSKTGGAALASEDLDATLQKPFRSKAQRRFAYANEEKFGGKEGIKEWEEKTPKNISEKIKKNESQMNSLEDNPAYLQHYSPQAGLKSIDPNKMGTGVDKRTRGRSLENKISFYYPHNYESPENIVTGQSKSKYTVKVPKDHKIYSSQEHGPDMIRMAKEKNNGIFSMDHFINTLKENGYHGFKSSPSGIDMVAMFHELPVHSEESIVKKNEKLEKNETNHFFLQPHILFSVEQPYHPTKYKINHGAFFNKLKQKGFDVDHVSGKYGGKENSIVVKNPTPEQASYINKVSQKLGQDSVIHSDGLNHKMLYLNGEKAGKYHIGQGTNIHEKEPEDFYSTTSLGTHFTHNFDFDNLHSDRPLKKHEKLKKMSQPDIGFPNLGIENNPRMNVKKLDKETMHEKKYKTKSGKEYSQADIEGKKIANKIFSGLKKPQNTFEGVVKDGKEGVATNNASRKNELRNMIIDKKRKDKEKEVVEMLDPKKAGTTIGTNRFEEGFDFSKVQTKEKMKQTKGKGNAPTTEKHESLHLALGNVARKYSKEHKKNLINHIIDNYFDPKDVKKLSHFVQDIGYKKDDPHFKEEILTHAMDLTQNPKKRDRFHSKFSHILSEDLKPIEAQKKDDERMKRIKNSYLKAYKAMKKLTPGQLEAINHIYNRKKIKNNEVKVQKIPPGLSGIKRNL
jgi:hypothetical protein